MTFNKPDNEFQTIKKNRRWFLRLVIIVSVLQENITIEISSRETKYSHGKINMPAYKKAGA